MPRLILNLFPQVYTEVASSTREPKKIEIKEVGVKETVGPSNPNARPKTETPAAATTGTSRECAIRLALSEPSVMSSSRSGRPSLRLTQCNGAPLEVP